MGNSIIWDILFALFATALFLDVARYVNRFIHRNDPDPKELLGRFDANTVKELGESEFIDCEYEDAGNGFRIVLTNRKNERIKSTPVKYHWFKHYKDEPVYLIAIEEAVVFKTRDLCAVMSVDEGDFE